MIAMEVITRGPIEIMQGLMHGEGIYIYTPFSSLGFAQKFVLIHVKKLCFFEAIRNSSKEIRKAVEWLRSYASRRSFIFI
jgi:hypothetical protein